MSVPTSISVLSEVPASNSPADSEPIGDNAANYIRTSYAFIKQIADGNGIVPTAALNFNGKQINNIANGVALTDAATVSQQKNTRKVGEIIIWSGAIANITSVWGTGVHLCDGTNGTPDLRDRFVIGAGNSYAVGAVGGTTSYALSTANMPAHNHVINIGDPGHAHSVYDPGHGHGASVGDGGHAHSFTVIAQNTDSNGTGAITGGSANTGNDGSYSGTTSVNGSGISVSVGAAGSNIGIYAAGTGVYANSNNTGSGTAFTVIPPYYALCFLMVTAIV